MLIKALQVLERSGGWSGGGAEPGLVLQIRPRDARLQPRTLLPGAGAGDHGLRGGWANH